jgi:chromosome segregation ATPase
MERALLDDGRYPGAPRRAQVTAKGEPLMFEENALFEISELAIVKDTGNGHVTAGAALESKSTGSAQQAGEKSALSLDSQANLLFGLIRDLKLLADRACDAAVREARHSSKLEEMASAEVTSLRLQLKEKIEELDGRDRTLRERETLAREKIDALEMALRDKEEQLENCQNRSQALLGEIEGLDLRLNEAAGAMKQAEARFRDFADHQQGKISFLCQELKNKDKQLQAKDAALQLRDEESRSVIGSLEMRLQAIDAILETKDAELREKQSALENSAAHEKTFAQLMQQLAVESQALMAELWQKNELVAELENKTYRSYDNGFPLDQSGAVQERLL